MNGVGSARSCSKCVIALLAACAASTLSCASSLPQAAEAPATVYVLSGPPPVKRAEPMDAPAVVEGSRPTSEWSVLPRGKDLPAALRNVARDAGSKRLLPVVFVGQASCEPCESLKHYRGDPRMQEALRGTLIIEVDLGRWFEEELATLGMNSHAIPALFVLDEEGRYTGKTITGGAWGDDIPENMAPPLTEFFLHARQP
jgi:hypothetical protein